MINDNYMINASLPLRFGLRLARGPAQEAPVDAAGAAPATGPVGAGDGAREVAEGAPHRRVGGLLVPVAEDRPGLRVLAS